MPRMAESPICRREDQDELKSWSASRTYEARTAVRANIIFLARDEHSAPDTAYAPGVTLAAVRQMEAHSVEKGLDGLFESPRSGRPPIYEPNATRTAIHVQAEGAPAQGPGGAGREGIGRGS